MRRLALIAMLALAGCYGGLIDANGLDVAPDATVDAGADAGTPDAGCVKDGGSGKGGADAGCEEDAGH